MMKRAIYYIIIIAAIFGLSGCYEWPENGDLDGMWQLTEWHDNTADSIVATNEDGIYYSFQFKLLKFQRDDFSGYYLSYFTHTGDSLIIGQTVFWPANEVRPVSELGRFGVPAVGRFHVNVLNSKHMVLSSDSCMLTFRKY